MMQYLVLETHPAYAVLLDEEGRFLKAANLHYTLGDRVTEIVELQPVPNGNAGRWKKSLASLSALAACLCLVFFGYYQPNFSPYGTLRLQINPPPQPSPSVKTTGLWAWPAETKTAGT